MTESVNDPEQLKKNRKVIGAIFGIPIIVLLLSTALYFLVETKTINIGTVNNGQLVTPPLEFSTLPLATSNGETFDYSKPEPKWAFVVIGDSDCINDCERMLYIARQSIISLAKKMHRVRLMYVTTDGAISESLQQRFDREYIGMDVLFANNNDVEKLFEKSDINPLKDNTFYTIDSRGWLMMHYEIADTQQQTLSTLGKAVVRDMKRLIK